MKSRKIGTVTRDGYISIRYPRNVCCGCGSQATEVFPLYSDKDLSLPICEECMQEESSRQKIWGFLSLVGVVGFVLLVLAVPSSPVWLTWLIQPLVSLWWLWLIIVNIALVILVWMTRVIMDNPGLVLGYTLAPIWQLRHRSWPIDHQIVSRNSPFVFIGATAGFYITCQDVYAEILDDFNT